MGFSLNKAETSDLQWDWEKSAFFIKKKLKLETSKDTGRNEGFLVNKTETWDLQCDWNKWGFFIKQDKGLSPPRRLGKKVSLEGTWALQGDFQLSNFSLEIWSQNFRVFLTVRLILLFWQFRIRVILSHRC